MKSKIAFCLLFSIFCLFFAFAQKTIISGKIENNKFSQADLQLLYKDDGVSFGKTNINADGTFKLTANISKPDLYKLVLGDGAQAMLSLLPGQKIELTLNANNLNEIVAVSGSPSIEFCKKTAEMYASVRTTFDSINNALQNDKDVLFYNELQSQFKPFTDANKDADSYCILLAKFTDSLTHYINSQLIKGKVDPKNIDAFIYTGSNILKEIATNYSKYNSYMQSMNLFPDFKSNRNQKYLSFYTSSVDRYLELLDQRNEKMQTLFAPFVKQVEKYVYLRDSLVINDLSDRKKEKELLATTIIDLSRKAESAKGLETSLIKSAQSSEGYGAYTLQEAQRHVSTTVSKYQTMFNNEEKKKKDAVVNALLANKNDLATLLFLDLYPRDQHVSLHQEVIKALYVKYPDHPLVSERNKEESAPTTATSIGAKAPELAFENPEGEIMKLSDLKGKVVLLDFWASWCRPCRVENPNVVKVYNKYHSKGFEVYSVSLDRDKASWVRAIEADGLIWSNHVSDLGYWQSQGAKIYGVSSIPATFLIDREGKIIAKNLRGDALENALKELFE